MRYSVVVPVFNSEASLAPLIDRLASVMSALGAPYEVICVDDGSTDGSWGALRHLAVTAPELRLLRLSRNFGQHNALLAGVRAARGHITITIDDDLQNPPEEIPLLIDALTEEVDVVYGSPRELHHGILRDCASLVTKLVLQHAMGASTARRVSAFRAFRTSLRDAFETCNGPYVSLDVLLTWGTSRFAAIPVRHDARGLGSSQYTFRKLWNHAANMSTGFSALPLQLASALGFALTGLGALVLAYVVGRYLWSGTTVPGFPFLASTIALFCGAQLFCLGILGEYLARIHFRVMGVPPYTVREDSVEPPDAP